MGRTKVFLLGLAALGVLVFAVFEAVRIFKPKLSGINVLTEPSSNVYINGELKGKTPYQGTFPPGEVILRLIPDTFETPLEPYDTKLTLVGGVETVVKYNFAGSEREASGEIISFEKNPGGETSLVVISVPDFVNMLIDGRERSTTPFKTSSISPGVHTVSLFADGYKTIDADIKTVEGYKLTLIAKLAQTGDVTNNVQATPSPTVMEQKPQELVEILPTSVGYLRVRSEPTTTSDEVGRVDPGKRYSYVSTDATTGWYEIIIEPADESGDSKTGWVSNQYARKIENEPQNTATSSASQ